MAVAQLALRPGDLSYPTAITLRKLLDKTDNAELLDFSLLLKTQPMRYDCKLQ